MKRIYQKPTMKVYEMKREAVLLVGSGEKSSPKRHGDEFGYIPGFDDENCLA